MEPHELHRHSEHALEKGQKAIGLTTAIVAVLVAVATMLSNRTHVLGGKLETQMADQWSAYNAKHSLTHNFSADTQQAELMGRINGILAAHLNQTRAKKDELTAEIAKVAGEQAKQFRASGEAEDRESEEAKNKALEMEKEAEALERSGDIYNVSELFLQVSIVLCSISLLAESLVFWKISFLSTLIGVGLLVYGLLG
jgi:hypothetical protein